MPTNIKRSQLLKRSVITALSSKGVSVITQIVAMPLAAGSLGVERFGAYVMLVAVFLWANIAYTSIGQALTVKIASTAASKDLNKEAALFSTVLFFSIGLAIVLAILFSISLNFINLGDLFGLKSTVDVSDVNQAAMIMAVLIVINVLFGACEATHAGYQKQYINSLFLMVANFFTIAALIFVQEYPSISNMVLAMFLPIALSRVFNLLYLLKGYRYLMPSMYKFCLPILKQLFVVGSGFALVQFGSLMYQQLSTIYVGAEIGLEEAAYFAVMMQVVAISGGLLIVFTQPLLPALKDSATRNDHVWIVDVWKKTIVKLIPYLIGIACLIALFGVEIVSVLLRTEPELNDYVTFLWAVFFFLVAWEHVCYIFLMGMGEMWLATWLYIMGALLMCLVGYFLVPLYGVLGAFFSMCMGPLMFTVIIYPLIINKKMRCYGS